VILIDGNILLYAYDAGSPRNQAARQWLETTLGQEPDVRFGLVTLLAFARIGTDPRVFERPLPVSDAITIVRTWLARPNVSVATPSERHWPILAKLVVGGKARGALVMDAHLAALAIEHGATLMTTDRDFGRFPGVRFRDPLAG